jgi:DNA-binding phage protein
MAKRITGKLTIAQKKLLDEKLAAAEKHKAAWQAEGKLIKQQHEQMLADLANVFQSLRSEREKQGLSLADVSARTGIPRESICRLENLEKGNFEIATIQRYAQALGLKIQVALVPAA